MRARDRVSALSLRKSLNSSHRPSRRNGCPYPSALSCRLARGLRALIRRRGLFRLYPFAIPAVRARVPLEDFKENRWKFKASVVLGWSSCRGVNPEGRWKAGVGRARARRIRAGGMLFRYRLVLIVCEGLTRGSRARQPPPDVVCTHESARYTLSPDYAASYPRRSLAPLSLSLSLGGLVDRPALRADRQIGSNTSRLYRVYTGVHQRRKMTYVLRKRVCDKAAHSLPPFEATWRFNCTWGCIDSMYVLW